MVAYLTSHGVQFEYNVQVLDVKVDVTTKDKVAKTIELKRNGNKETIHSHPMISYLLLMVVSQKVQHMVIMTHPHLLQKILAEVGTYGVT